MATAASKPRVEWVDIAKGICIVLVVMMHSTLGVEKAVGHPSWLNHFVEWARPFRMPDFFMISGLFLASRINRPWREYLDKKVIHFAYFYILWMTIQFLTKGYGIYQGEGAAGLVRNYALGFIDPFGTLWFIYLLAVFFVVAKATRGLPPLLIFAVGAAMEAVHARWLSTTGEATGWLLIDEFMAKFVYFYVGHWLAPRIFALAQRFNALGSLALFAGLVVWGIFEYFAVLSGHSKDPGVSLALGFIGALAVIATSVLLARTVAASVLNDLGANSIVVYLAFFLFMASARAVLLRLDLIPDTGTVALLVTFAGVVGPVLLHLLVKNTRLAFLFKRPQWAKLAPTPGEWHSPGHDRKQPREA